ncbi:hypothetical protein CBUD_1803a [Coxiella burnetii Dugway 5J108-111]|uniref:Peptidase A2 domain-containing protein n=1 Tax=Coxiella burnetii (strain Dugway 5J108-111) TaxID=434922 RepID=B5XHI5_COXBN|nr:hypothetical protein CBUD_1803a [Coxiella burnetii Dugway 5J108-111]
MIKIDYGFFLEKQRYQNIPLTRLSSGHFILPVQINQAAPVYFLFDTGTGETTLSDHYVNYLHIHPNTHYQTQAASQGTIKVADITLKTITFNPLQTFFLKPIMLHDRKVSAANIASLARILGVAGVLGLTDVEKLQTIIDIPTQSIFIR